ncbi:hypothetical protein SRRS_09880 [Sporomusa rhizae]|uniref:DUF2680 domain-containing protein n=1 Tax=Sporomusa rhizae TaxID=357999 RepID=UPI00352A76E3
MKKITGFALVGVLVLSLAGAVVFAAPKGDFGPGGFCPPVGPNGQQVTLNDEQKAQFAAWHQERIEQEKQVLKKQVEWGWITQEQADQRIAFMEQRQKQVTLTDEQKAQFATWHQERVEQEKQVLKKQVEWGWITQEQADKRIAFMEQHQKDGNFGMGMGHGHHGKGMGMGPRNGECPNFAPAGQKQ